MSDEKSIPAEQLADMDTKELIHCYHVNKRTAAEAAQRANEYQQELFKRGVTRYRMNEDEPYRQIEKVK